MSPSKKETNISVESELRFALISPGDDYPKVLISGGDAVSELVGYFSIKRLGLEKFAESDFIGNRSIVSYFFPPLRNSSAEISSLEVWKMSSKNESREVGYSLVVGSPVLSKEALSELPELEDGLTKQLHEIIDSFQQKNLEKLEYQANILNSILSGSNRKYLQYQQRMRLNQLFSTLIGVATIFTVFVVIISINFK